ncbi:transmembrane protein, putative [Medicago truncatula]|uniref:Transmembrane protein, putative n=1 Tax=Medicago truncatula TaxID=3880 RepID=G7IKW3_MEDTR|nr:transmembrane protein, putative [Medicago truncatula]
MAVPFQMFSPGWQPVAATNSGVMMVVGATMIKTTAETVLAAFMKVLAKRRVNTDVLKACSCGFVRFFYRAI